LVSVEFGKVQKYSLCLFSQNILSLSVSHNVTLLFENSVLFFKTCVYWWERDKLKKNFLIRNLNVLDIFSSSGYSKNFKFEKVMIIQAHTHDGENGKFFICSEKNTNLH